MSLSRPEFISLSNLRGLFPGGSPPGGSLSGGSLSIGVSVQGVSVTEPPGTVEERAVQILLNAFLSTISF